VYCGVSWRLCWHSSRPVESFCYGDDRKSCEALQAEITDIEKQVETKRDQHNQIIAANIFITIIGLVIFFPLLFAIDTRSEPLIEIEAFIKRRETLGIIAKDSKCEFCADKDYSRAVFIAEHDLAILDQPKVETAEYDPRLQR